MDVGMLLVRHEPASAAVVRREIAADLTAQSIFAGSIDDVVLVVSELVGNAVTHASDVDDLDVTWTVEGGTVIVRVHDGSHDQPRVKHVDETSTNGRGLAIVAAIADEWGVRHAARGKQVWARVPVRRAS